ncbi:MAG: hypothetical protein ABIE47_13895 [Pseudomonadota bacterium]
MVGVFGKSPAPGFTAEAEGFTKEPSSGNGHDFSEFEPWVPDPLRSDRFLRCKYGVLINKDMAKGEMSAALYETAYKQKLMRLIEKEVYTPLSVILDRYFTAPHLAAGDPKQVADALWEELEEIRNPVQSVREWLENMDDESLLRMIHPRSLSDLKDETVGNEQLRRELDDISLEDFLKML